MKKLILLAVLAAMGLQVQAQIVSSRSAMTTREVYGSDEVTTYKGWSTLGVEYLPSTWSGDNDSESFTGLALNYTRAISLTQSAPIFLEVGLGGQYSFKSEDDQKFKIVSAKVPINFIYSYAIPGSDITLDPYVGMNFRVNIWGEYKDYYGKTSDLFDSNEGDWNRFQVGIHFGLKARFNNKFFIGAGYGLDFSEIAKKIKVNEGSISLGLVF